MHKTIKSRLSVIEVEVRRHGAIALAVLIRACNVTHDSYVKYAKTTMIFK